MVIGHAATGRWLASPSALMGCQLPCITPRMVIGCQPSDSQPSPSPLHDVSTKNSGFTCPRFVHVAIRSLSWETAVNLMPQLQSDLSPGADCLKCCRVFIMWPAGVQFRPVSVAKISDFGTRKPGWLRTENRIAPPVFPAGFMFFPEIDRPSGSSIRPGQVCADRSRQNQRCHVMILPSAPAPGGSPRKQFAEIDTPGDARHRKSGSSLLPCEYAMSRLPLRKP